MSDDDDIRNEIAALLATKDSRPFVIEPCPACGLLGGFLVNADGSRFPALCVPCSEPAAASEEA